MQLLVRLAARLPPGLHLLSSPAADHRDSLYPTELRSIARAVGTRRNEFSTSRWLARRGLAKLGVEPGPIPPGPAGEPIWPAGVVGSLTHSSSMCASLTGLARGYESVGLDLELSQAPKAAAGALILSPSEPREYLAPDLLRLVFSAKESVYKCLYPICRSVLHFRHLDVRLQHSTFTFSVAASSETVPPGVLARGHGLFEAGEYGVVTSFSIPARR